jgi:hypothetical protein
MKGIKKLKNELLKYLEFLLEIKYSDGTTMKERAKLDKEIEEIEELINNVSRETI